MSAFPQPELFRAPAAPRPIAPQVPQGPFPTPTPLPQPRSNLAPHAGPGGVGLSVTGAEPSGAFKAENIKISWWVKNTGPFTTSQTFTVELRLDGTAVAQWSVDGLSISSFVFIEERAGLFSGIRPSAGVHEISLVIDPLNKVIETLETDNTVSKLITLLAPPVSDTALELLPNLVLVPGTGKAEPIFASSHEDDPLSGKLSIDRPSHIAFSVRNESVQYVTEDVDVDLFLDGLLVRRVTWDGLAATGEAPFRIADLRSIVDIAPGAHTLRVVVDPLDRIREQDETDNDYEVELVWGVGEPEAAAEPFLLEPPPREPTIRANLMPFRRFGWDAALTARQADGRLPVGKDGWLNTQKAIEIDFAFTNASRFSLPLTDQLKAAVLLDGVQVELLQFSSGTSNVGSIWEDTIVFFSNTVSPGDHTVRIVLDPDGLFDEINEDDNIFERVFTFHDGPDLSTPAEFEMSEQEIAAAFAPLSGEMMRQVKPVLGPGAGDRDWSPEIIAAGRAGYFLLTGRDVDEEGYVIHFLPPDEFDASSVSACMSGWITMTVNEYEEAFESCTVGRGEIGFKTRSNGQIHLFVDLGLSPMEALGTYFHELGHGLQDLTSPGQTVLPFLPNTRGLFEAQAQIFEAAAWRAIEEFTGNSLSSFPDITLARDRLEFIFSTRASSNTEHNIGYRLLWAQALAGTPALEVGLAGFNLADKFRTDGRLDSAGANELYNFLVGIFPFQVESWAAALLANSSFIAEFRQIAEARLIEDLALELTGNPAVQDTAWIAP